MALYKVTGILKTYFSLEIEPISKDYREEIEKMIDTCHPMLFLENCTDEEILDLRMIKIEEK